MTSSTPTALRSTRGPLCLSALMILSALVWPRVTSEPGLWLGLLGALGAGLLSYLWATQLRRKEGGAWGVTWSPRRAHILQCVAQGLVYLGWCAHWEVGLMNLPLIIAQVGFAYLLEMSWALRRSVTYHLGVGPVPIVLSTNLFLFFKDEAYYWQWPMIALAVLSKELLRWRREGREVHIFNPSAIALSLTALLLISAGEMDSAWGEEIARSHATAPWSYELMFGAGLLVMALFGVGPTVVSAVMMSLALGYLYHEQTGTYRYLDTAIPAAVFLGMNLLVTDPATSPKRVSGRVIYGALYGLCVFILYGLLRGFERPPMGDDPGLSLAFCDKLLAVPLLNLLTPSIDRVTAGLSRLSDLTPRLFKGRAPRLAFTALWALTFLGWVRPQLRAHPGRSLEVWLKACDETPAPQRARFACANRDRIYRRICDQGDLEACHNLALSWEQGEGGFIDASLAGSLYQRACEGGKLLSCHHLGGLFVLEAERAQDREWITKATPLLRRACEGEVWGACARLAALKLSQWAERDEREEAWSLWERSCAHGEPFACLELGQRALLPPQLKAQRCRQGDKLACLSAEWAQRQQRLRPDLDPLYHARRALMLACQGELLIACANVSWMMWRGDGGARDQTQALRLMSQSCQGGLKDACERAKTMRQELTPRPTQGP